MKTTPRIAYVDCFSGISGNMFLGALLHAGVDDTMLRDGLGTLDIGPYNLVIDPKTCGTIHALHVSVESAPRPGFRHLASILTLLERAKLPHAVKEKSAAVFQALAEAEAKVHGIPLEQVHFHEIGAQDTLIDVVGTVLGLHLLGIERLTASPVPLGRGHVRCAHGTLPLPAPAVCELLRDVPIYGVPLDLELVTPTGAALLKVLADHFGPLEPMVIERTGYGAGSHILPEERPNLLRCIIGRSSSVSEAQEVEVIETNLDDWNPEGFPYLCDLLFHHGALDVSIAPLQMKKGRPGFQLQVISSPALGHALKEMILSETSAIGLRFRKEQRYTLAREAVDVDTRWGKVRAKKVRTPSGMLIYPEYEACRAIADRYKIPLQVVYREIYRADDMEPNV